VGPTILVFDEDRGERKKKKEPAQNNLDFSPFTLSTRNSNLKKLAKKFQDSQTQMDSETAFLEWYEAQCAASRVQQHGSTQSKVAYHQFAQSEGGRGLIARQNIHVLTSSPQACLLVWWWLRC